MNPIKLRALSLHYGSIAKAAKSLGISEATFKRAATADLRGREQNLSKLNQEKVAKKLKRLSDSSKRKLSKYEKTFDRLSEHPNVARTILNANTKQREKIFKNYNKYSKAARNNQQLWRWVMAAHYHQNRTWNFRKGRK